MLVPAGALVAGPQRELHLSYSTDADRLAHPMGQFQQWGPHLFYWSGAFLGWRLVR